MVILLSLVACGPRFVEEQVDGFRVLTASVKADRDGVASASFDVLDGETSVLITSTADDDLSTSVEFFSDQTSVLYDATALYQSPYALTNAIFPSAISTLGWPVRAVDPPLAPGKHTVFLGMIDRDFYEPRGRASVTIVTKSDADLTSGTVRVAFFLTPALDADETFRTALDNAISTWESLYEAIGISLSIEFVSGDAPTQLQPPGFGSEGDYLALSTETNLGTVNVIITEDIQSSFQGILGVSGDIPGPAIASTRSAVLVDALQAMGPDGRFVPLEVRLLAETLAHETGHYLGLFHPVEDGWQSWDSLEDTPECSSQNSCIEVLDRNLMFPFPICSSVTCTAQDEITEAQAGVMHRYVGVD